MSARVLAAPAVALLLACAPDPAAPGREPPARDGGAAAARGIAPAPCPPERTVSLRIRAGGEGGPASLPARLAALEVFADDAPLAVEVAADALDLRRDRDALLGSIRLPERAGAIRVSIALDAPGARACSAPVAFEVEAAELLRGCGGWVVLDLARSVVPREDGTTDLLPQFRVSFQPG